MLSSSKENAMGASASTSFVVFTLLTVIGLCRGLVFPPFAFQPSSPQAVALVEPLPIVQYFPSSAYAGAWHADPRGVSSSPDPTRTTQTQRGYPSFKGNPSSSSSSSRPSRPVMDGVREWLVPSAHAATEPPTEADVKLLREAYNMFYGDRDPVKAEPLLTGAIDAWDKSGQPADERAALYRIRANCRMLLFRPADALADYDETIRLLEGPGGDAADPSEVPEAYLGRARALRSRGMGDVAGGTRERAARAAADYGRAIRLLSREEWDTDAELEEDGTTRNPYAAYEWGTALRVAGDPRGAARVHGLADDAFDLVGDGARSVISGLDAGIDLAATGDVGRARGALERAIKRTTSVEGRDVALLQRVIAKEGEARIALASVLWSSGDRPEAEGQLGEACLRLDQLEADAAARSTGGGARERKAAAMVKTVGGELPTLGFSIDDLPGAGEVSCSRFKNAKFLTDTLGWPEELQMKVKKLQSLGK